MVSWRETHCAGVVRVSAGAWGSSILLGRKLRGLRVGQGLPNPKSCPQRLTSLSKTPPLKGPTTSTNTTICWKCLIQTQEPMEDPAPPTSPGSLMFYVSCSQDTLGHLNYGGYVLCVVITP